jgi:hypothetical protein
MAVAALLAVQQSLQQTASQASVAADTAEQNSCSPRHQQQPQQPPISPRRKKAGQQQPNPASKGSGSGNLAEHSSSGIRLHVVAVLSSYSVRRAAQVFLGSMLVRNFSYEIMVLDEYAGAMLLQVSATAFTVCLACCNERRVELVQRWALLLQGNAAAGCRGPMPCY